MKKTYTHSFTKHLILKNIWTNPGTSRIALSKELNLNKSTITTLINELIDIGIIIVRESGTAGPKGGRRPVGLDINTDFGFILGLEIGTDSYIAAGVSFHGTILFSSTGEIEWETFSLDRILKSILERLQPKIDQLRIPLLGIGLGIPGTVDPLRNIIYNSDPLEIYETLDFTSLSKSITDVPVIIENDGNCCAWGELVFRKDKCPDNFLYILSEFRSFSKRIRKTRVPAVGFGLVLGRKIQYGELHTSGEFQSVFHSPEYLNSFSFSDDLLVNLEKNPSLMEDMIRELSKNIALLVNVLNLKAVIIGGSLKKQKETVKTVFLEEIRKNWPTSRPFVREILFSELDKESVAFGSAAMFVETIFSSYHNGTAKIGSHSDLFEGMVNKLNTV